MHVKKIRKRKNPSLEKIIEDHPHLLINPIFLDLLKQCKFKYLSSGAVRDVFYFETTNIKLRNYQIPEGSYVIKINKIYNRTNYKNEKFKSWRIEECIKVHINFSKLGLIPKIYFIDPDFMIMKYVPGKTLDKIIHDKSISKEKIQDLINKRNSLELILGKFWPAYDVSDDNFIVSPDFKKIYYIDPC